MQIQSAHDREQILGSLCILYCLIRPWITYWATQKHITYHELYGGLKPQKIPSVYSRGPPHTAVRVFPKEPYCPRRNQSVLEGTRECLRRNQSVSPKELYHIFGRWPATPYSPILVRQYKYTTCSCLMQSWIINAYVHISTNSISTYFPDLQKHIISYIAGVTLLTSILRFIHLLCEMLFALGTIDVSLINFFLYIVIHVISLKIVF